MATQMLLKRRHAELPAVLARVDRDLQRITPEAYANVDLVSNEVLSRNPWTTELLHNVAWRTRTPRRGWAGWLIPLAQYYGRSLKQFLLYVITWAVQRTASDRQLVALDGAAYVIDTYVYQDAVASEGRYEERFFPGLAAVLRKRGRNTVIVPRFYGPVTNPLRVARLLRILRSSGETFLTEFDVIRASDLVRVAGFILRYPIAVLKLARRVARQPGDVNVCAGDELEATLPQVTFRAHLRYLVGRRLGERARGPLHVISWFENQALEKNFYRGIKETARTSVVFGCQPFVFSPALINAFVADREVPLKVTPDVVVVGAPVYIRHSSVVPHRIGPSFRYGWLWSAPIDWSQKRGTVVFLPYLDRLSRDILTVAAAAERLCAEPVVVKAHPAQDMKRLPELPSAWRYTDQTTTALLRSATTVITTGSGTAVEAVASGCSVVVIASQSTVTFNPLIEDGRGQIWELVFDGAELDSAAARLRDYRDRHPEHIRRLAEAYRDVFFVEPTEQRIVEAFEL